MTTKYPLIISSFLYFYSLSAPAQSSSCLVCSFPISKQASEAGLTDPCEDLFGATCTGKNGKSKYDGGSKTLNTSLQKNISDARSKTVQAMGYKDIDEAVKAKLKEAGLDLVETPDATAYKNLKKENDGSTYSNSNDSEKLFANSAQCAKDLKDLQAVQYYQITDPVALKDVEAKYSNFVNGYREKSIKYYAMDIPNYISSIGSKCSQLDSGGNNYKKEDNEQLYQTCSNFGELKRKAVDLYRSEGSSNYSQLAEKFVQDSLTPDLKYSQPVTVTSNTTSNGQPPPEKTEVEKIMDRISGMSSSLNCYNFESLQQSAGNKVVTDLYTQISKSKTTVDSLVDSVYTKDREKIANQLFKSAKNDIEDLSNSFVKDPQKRSEIATGYDSLKLYWMKKPDDSAYIKDKNGNLVLDENKNLMNPDQTSSTFFDPSLSFFSTVNAFYTPSASFGKQKVEEQVNLMPAFVSMLETNPYAYLSVVAHEAGHKIGPMVSQINGYDLTPQYSDLLKCYKNNDSIKMLDIQKDEVMADYFSSEVLAREIQKLPPDKRQSALMSSMEGYCLFDDMSTHQHTIYCTGNHPVDSLRVSGIFGSNPSLRKVMGCTKDSTKFRTCGLKQSILDAPETQKASSMTGTTDTNDSKGTKGVK